MKILGNDIYIQRGETWSLDFDIMNDKGDPYMIFKQWQNPYLAITVTAARYEQKGDYRHTYWLDLSNGLVEQNPDTHEYETTPIKKFISTEALYLSDFSLADVRALYGDTITISDANSDFYVSNYLFFVDPRSDGNRIYKYFAGMGERANEELYEMWVEYRFRVVKQFDTKSWIEQGYLFDMKLLAGESVREHVAAIIGAEGNPNNWSDEQMQAAIDDIEDEAVRLEMQELYDSGAPLMPTYDTKSLILQPTNLYVSANIQGGVR